MPPREWKMRIKDILDAIRTVQGYTKDMEYEAFVAHRKTVDAVIRNFIIIGEAATHVPERSGLGLSGDSMEGYAGHAELCRA
jgi:uncharacterized protein with HEPN domain